MQEIVLKVKDGQDISFIGQIVANVLDRTTNEYITVYETQKEHWFIAYTTVKDVLVRDEIIKNKVVSELIDSLGFSQAAKTVYEEMGIETTKKLDI